MSVTNKQLQLSAPTEKNHNPVSRFGFAALLLLGLLIFSETVEFRYDLGLVLFLLACLLVVAATIMRSPEVRQRALWVAALIFLLTALPLLEAAGIGAFLSVMFGLSVYTLTAAGYFPAALDRFWQILWRFAYLAPFRFVWDVFCSIWSAWQTLVPGKTFTKLAVWIIPFLCSGIFLMLFADANPLIENLLIRIDPEALLSWISPVRIMFWFGLSMFVWPFLLVKIANWRDTIRTVPQESLAKQNKVTHGLIFGRAAILRSLILFNLLFAVQTSSDIFYLWAGQALPDGMSYASYAHRGAYPLVVTALLAAAFVLIAMRKNGPGEKSRPVRLLVYLWIGQNVMLVLSSILRLNLYVSQFSLTQLRLAASIWMGLVIIGLISIVWRIHKDHSNNWLISTNLSTLSLIIFGFAFVDTSAIIAQFNVEHSIELSGKGSALDIEYFEYLGVSGLPALDFYISQSIANDRFLGKDVLETRRQLVHAFNGRCKDWQCWSFRDWRMQQYLMATIPLPDEQQEDAYEREYSDRR